MNKLTKVCLIVGAVVLSVSSYAQHWTLTGSDIKNNNTGNVGIGTDQPAFGRLQIDQSTDTPDHGLAILNVTGQRAMRLWTDSNNSYIYSAGSGSANLVLNNTGQVSVGANSNYGRFQVNQTADASDKGLAVLNSTNQTSVRLWTDASKSYIYSGDLGNKDLILNGTGKVGIGFTSPISKLSIVAGTNASSANNNGVTVYSANDNTKVRSSLTVTGDDNGRINLYNSYTTLKAHINSNGISYFNGGNVGIGTTTPDEKLTVKGNIHAEEVRVDLNVPHPDYVFLPSYDLLTLEEVKQHIEEKGHLPNIPSASEVEENGLNLGEMNAKLLEKIEELTLYILQEKEAREKEIELMKAEKDAEIAGLKARIEKLENK